MQSFESFMSTIFLRFYINGSIGIHTPSRIRIPIMDFIMCFFSWLFLGETMIRYGKYISEYMEDWMAKVNEWQMSFVCG